MPARTHAKLMTKNQTKISLSPHRHFIEHLMGVFGKQPFERNWNYKTSSFSIRQLRSTTRMSSCNNHFAEDQIDDDNGKIELEKVMSSEN
jgi:hypothetical protein